MPVCSVSSAKRCSSEPPLDHAERAVLDAQEDVLDHAARGDERQLLGDRRDAVLDGARGASGMDGPPLHAQLAGVRRDHPGDDLAQGGLAGPVLPDERMDGAAREGEGRVIDGDRRPVALGDARELDVGNGDRRSWTDQPFHSAVNLSTLSAVMRPSSGSVVSGSMPPTAVPSVERRDERLHGQLALGRGGAHDVTEPGAVLDALDRRGRSRPGR